MLFSNPRGLSARLIFAAAMTLMPVACGGSHSRTTYPPDNTPYTPPPSGTPTGYITFQWTLADVGNQTATQSLNCEDVGATWVVLTMGSVTTTFPCSAYQGTSRLVAVGTYDVAVDLYGPPTTYSSSNVLLDTISLPAQAIYAGANDFSVADFLVNSFVLSWTISRSGIGTTCEAVGATRVELDVTFAGQSAPTAYYFDCNNTNIGAGGLYTSATLSIPYANPPYAVQWQAYLLDRGGHDLTPGTTLQSLNVTADVQADLGTVHFTF